MKRQSSRSLDETINVRLQHADMSNLKAVCARLDLEQSEVARRCIKEGLKTFRNMPVAWRSRSCR